MQVSIYFVSFAIHHSSVALWFEHQQKRVLLLGGLVSIQDGMNIETFECLVVWNHKVINIRDDGIRGFNSETRVEEVSTNFKTVLLHIETLLLFLLVSELIEIFSSSFLFITG